MNPVEAITIVALIAGPAAAVWIGNSLQARSGLRAQRLSLFMSLLATRHDVFSPERIRALSLIDVQFNKYPEVRRKWASYYSALSDSSSSKPGGAMVRMMKFFDLLTQMARAVGYGKDVSIEDLSRSYLPQLVADTNEIQHNLQREFLRVLTDSDNFGMARKDLSRLPGSTQAQS